MTKKQSTKPDYTRFIKAFGLSFAITMLILCGAVFIANPFNNMPLRPLHTTQNYFDVEQRFFYPAIARQTHYDSAVIGTSTLRALMPEDLNRIFGGNFAQLALNNGQAYEQYRLFKLFMRHHRTETIKTLIFDIDVKWCQRKDDFVKTERSYPFPDYLYDENPWNDVPYLFNTKMLEIIGRMVNYRLFDKGRIRHQPDGWGHLWPDEDWDLTQARRLIYGTEDGSVKTHPDIVPPFSVSDGEKSEWRYAVHDFMQEMLATTPDTTQKLMIFPPYHVYKQGNPDSEGYAIMQECKNRIVSMATGQKNILVVDFMMDTPLTHNDANYWDDIHYTQGAAKMLTKAVETVVNDPLAPSELYTVLYADWHGTMVKKEYP